MPIEKIKDDSLEERSKLSKKDIRGYRGSSYFKRDGEDASY